MANCPSEVGRLVAGRRELVDLAKLVSGISRFISYRLSLLTKVASVIGSKSWGETLRREAMAKYRLVPPHIRVYPASTFSLRNLD